MFFVGASAPNSELNSATVSQVNSFRGQPHHPPPPPPPPPPSIPPLAPEDHKTMDRNFEKSDDDDFESRESRDRIGPLNSKSMKRNSMTNGVIQELEKCLLAEPDPIFHRYRKPVTHQIVPDVVDIDINNTNSHAMPGADIGYFENLLDIYKSPSKVSNDDDPQQYNGDSLDHFVGTDTERSSFLYRSNMMASSIQTMEGTSNYNHNSEKLLQSPPHESDKSNQKYKLKPTTMINTSIHSTHSSNDRTQRLSVDTGSRNSTHSLDGQRTQGLSLDSGPSNKILIDELNASNHSTRSATLRTTSPAASCFPFLGSFYFNQRKASSDSNLAGSVDLQISPHPADPSLPDIHSPVKSLSQSAKSSVKSLSQSAKDPFKSLSQSAKNPVKSLSQSAKGPAKIPMVSNDAKPHTYR